MFAALDTLEVPDPGSEYGQRVWKELAPRLRPLRGATGDGERVAWWQGLFTPRRFAAFAGVAALVVVAFFAGRGVLETRIFRKRVTRRICGKKFCCWQLANT